MDPWRRFREFTSARIGLDRAGDGLSTKDLLAFQLGHARARDAVYGQLEVDRIVFELEEFSTIHVASQAQDRTQYLLRPDLGRLLSDDFVLPKGEWDIAIVIADGLSATAANQHGVLQAREIIQRLDGWRVAPIILAQNARVAIGDPIGEALGAKMIAVLIGERPGLTVSDSLGIYLTHSPQIGRRDSERNCISNIHRTGLTYAQASKKLLYLATQARQIGYTGVNLKEAADDSLAIQNHQLLSTWFPVDL